MAVSPSLIAEAVGWRREFHAAPELGYQEQETSRRVAELLSLSLFHISHPTRPWRFSYAVFF